MKYLKFLLLGLGVWILVWTIRSVGPGAILDNLHSLGWKFWALLSIFSFVYFFNAWGWIHSFPTPLPARVPFRDVFWVRLIGETLNVVIPWAASLGGEPVKAEILWRRHGVRQSVTYASVMIVHSSYFVSLSFFVTFAMFLTFRSTPLPGVLMSYVMGFLAVLTLVTAVMVWGMFAGFFRGVHGLIGKLRKKESEETKARYAELDRAVRAYYAEDPRRFVMSVGFNFLAWGAGAVETWAILNALGRPTGFAEAWLLESLFQVLRIMTFFIPASIGAQEGGIVFIFGHFGMAGPFALAFALVRRMREIAYLAVGLVAWGLLRDKKNAAPDGTAEPAS